MTPIIKSLKGKKKKKNDYLRSKGKHEKKKLL